MWEKRHHDSQPVCRARLLYQFSDKLLVAEMYTIEHTNRHNRRLLERRLRKRKSSLHVVSLIH
jgi:hypothetical protein